MTENLVEVHHLKKYFHQGRPDEVHAIDDVSFNIQRGEVFGLVGESGSGKTTTGRCILNLYQPTSGDIIYDGEDVTKLKGHQKLKEFHQKTSMIFKTHTRLWIPGCQFVTLSLKDLKFTKRLPIVKNLMKKSRRP